MDNVYDYWDAGMHVFGVYSVIDGVCECGQEDCKALYKHPRVSSWQNVPLWNEQQLENYAEIGHFATGFGVLCNGYLVIDVDARNGGVASFAKLCERMPSAATSEFIVNTGSGGGSQHHYFKLSSPAALVQNHTEYPGIDFKTSGYVIGAGSRHISGNNYEAVIGSPSQISEAPADLVAMLKKPETYRVSLEGSSVDVDAQKIIEMLGFISPNLSYEPWVKIGMAIHHCLAGEGFEIWDEWSQGGTDYPGSDDLSRKWHSFGKSANPAGYGTILHYAREGGYAEEVVFEFISKDEPSKDVLDTSGIDLSRPPGFVGELTDWINGQCLYPRETLAVAAALCAVSSLAGMRHFDALDDMTPNMIAFCVAGSGTGKEAVQQAYLKIMRTAGVQAALHGGFKSEQEVMRNLIRHQAAFYSIDEFGLVLRKLENASKRGGASYLEGIIGLIMSVYSKANGYLPVTGDLKEEIKGILLKEVAALEKRIDNLPADSSSESKKEAIEREKNRIFDALKKIDDGIENPYLTILGYTTPVTFNDLMGFEQATNGFMARAMIFSDLETNPRRKRDFKKSEMSDSLQIKIRNLYAPGYFGDMSDMRIEHLGVKSAVPSTPEAVDALSEAYERFHAMAEDQKGTTGLEAIPRRGYEIAAKVSLILAMPEGVRTAEHVRWGYALAKRDVEQKIKLAYATDNSDTASGAAAKILALLTKEHSETLGAIRNRLRPMAPAAVDAVLEQLVDKRAITKVEDIGKNNKPVVRFILA